VFSDGHTLITGGFDNLVLLWRVLRNVPVPPRSSSSSSGTSTRLKLSHLMRGHSAPITCVCASKAWSVLVSGSEDGSAIMWDLNRATYVRSLWEDGEAVRDVSGLEGGGRGVSGCVVSDITVSIRSHQDCLPI
jgi:WD40 repeat protein